MVLKDREQPINAENWLFVVVVILLLALSLLICHCSKLYRNPKEEGTSLKVPAHMLKDPYRCSSFGMTSCFMFPLRRRWI